MDTGVIASIIIAIVAVIPGTLALIVQSKKEGVQARLDLNKAANDAAVSMLLPLQSEVTRLQARIVELEKLLMDKTTQIGDLLQSGIDKDTKIRALQYTMEGMQMRLDAFEDKKASTTKKRAEIIEHKITAREEATNKIEEELKLAVEKKAEIKDATDKEIQQIASGSVASDVFGIEVQGE